MNCEQFGESGTIEQYFVGKLSQEEQDAFEQHYFVCDRCFEAVRIVHATRQALLAAGRPAAPEPIPLHKRASVWAVIGIAAAILIGAILIPGKRSTEAVPGQVAELPNAAPLSPELQLLARMDAPAYVPQTLRGTESASTRSFQQAMAPYSAHDYSAAADELRKVLEREPASLDARYFLGICELLTGNLEAGISDLQSVIAAGNASPYVEEARFYLAKAYLNQGKLALARSELETVVATNGDLHTQARDILDHLQPR